jgi:hypothetical protein
MKTYFLNKTYLLVALGTALCLGLIYRMLPAYYFPYALYGILRVFIPLLILRRPLFGMVLAIVVDTFDLETIRIIGKSMDPSYTINEFYQLYDKVFDIYFHTLAFYTSLGWTELLAKRTSIVLYFYRLIGVIIFEITQIRAMLFYFNSLFDFFFLFYVYMKHKDPNYEIKTKKRLCIILLTLLVPKLIQEYTLHIIYAKPIIYLRYTILKSPW